MNSGCLDREGIKNVIVSRKKRGRKKKAQNDKLFFCNEESSGKTEGEETAESSGAEVPSIEEIEEFSCNLCPKTFTSRNGLKYHISNHKHRPFTCHICLTSKIVMLRTQEELDYHIERKHTKVKCEYPNCNYENIKTKLREHVNAKHLNIRKFQCDHCEYSGTTGAHLRRHMSVHTNEKRFKCQWCDYRSNQRPNTVNHEKLYCKYRKIAT